MQNSRQLEIVLKLQDQASKELKTVSNRLESIQPTLKKVAVAGAAAGAALGTLTFAVSGLVKEAMASEQIGESFERMTKQIGLDADLLIQKLNEASVGTVALKDIMLSSNRAMALGVGNDIETITSLMEIARLKGRALGLTTTQAFNDIVTGIGRGSPLILDNLGIIIKLGEANEAYAKSLGKTAQELTAAEQKQALLNAVMEAGRAEVEAAGEIVLTASERWQQMSSTIADLRALIGNSFLPILEDLIQTIQPVIQSTATWVEQNPVLTRNIILATAAVLGIVTMLGALAATIMVVTPLVATLGTVIGALSLPILAIIGLLAVIGASLLYLTKNWQQHCDNVKWAWEQIKQASASAVNWIKEKVISPLIDMLDGVIDKFRRAIELAKEVGGKVRSSATKAIEKVGNVLDVNDAIISPNGNIITTHPEDYLIATKNPMALAGGGATINISIDSFYGEQQFAEKMGDKIIKALEKTMRF